jgi:hypothetical protein
MILFLALQESISEGIKIILAVGATTDISISS